ncbi:MAG: tRNA (guanosine(37)-N1)-methyltransferase TrmD [Minisyncoccia bacterium]
MKFYIITLFPESFKSYINTSIFKRAINKKIISLHFIQLRDFANDKRLTVDDKPYGGGPGMVLKIEPIYKAVKYIQSKIKNKNKKFNTRIILFSTRGKILNQKIVKRLSKYKNLIFICGRYEGVDERVAKYIADEEISIGNFVLSGGELPAMVTMEAISRHLPGVLGKYESLEDIKGYYPVYTRPPVFKNWVVPSVLLSGDHQKIKKWRDKFNLKNKKVR